MKTDYKEGDKIFILQNAQTNTGFMNRGKILTVLKNYAKDGYVLTTEENCGGIWYQEIRLATEADLLCNNYSII
jgi:hypothetical protein